jgi:hypothetical protein
MHSGPPFTAGKISFQEKSGKIKSPDFRRRSPWGNVEK